MSQLGPITRLFVTRSASQADTTNVAGCSTVVAHRGAGLLALIRGPGGRACPARGSEPYRSRHAARGLDSAESHSNEVSRSVCL